MSKDSWRTVALFFISFAITMTVFNYLDNEEIKVLKQQTIEHGCAQYSSQTGEWGWIKK